MEKAINVHRLITRAELESLLQRQPAFELVCRVRPETGEIYLLEPPPNQGRRLSAPSTNAFDTIDDVGSSPQQTELWLDLLRCAGPPRAVSQATSERIDHELGKLPVAAGNGQNAGNKASRVAHLYIAALAELGTAEAPNPFDATVIIHESMPLLQLLAQAESPLPILPPLPDAMRGLGLFGLDFNQLWEQLSAETGQSTGVRILKHLQPLRVGAVAVLAWLAEVWPGVDSGLKR